MNRNQENEQEYETLRRIGNMTRQNTLVLKIVFFFFILSLGDIYICILLV